MNRSRWSTLAVLSIVFLVPALAQAQPGRQIPGTRPHLPGSPPANFPEANSRTRPANSQVGLESTDFYGKKGYPRVLGDTIEAATSGAGGAAAAGISGGNTGVQAAGSGGFQGNTGNQIGQNGGGTILGGIFGFSNNVGNGFGGNPTTAAGLTGGGFTGMVPKGFGFGGTPNYSPALTPPLSGISGR